MHAQPRRLRHGIDQMAKGRAGPEDEIIALGEMARGHPGGIEALQGSATVWASSPAAFTR